MLDESSTVTARSEGIAKHVVGAVVHHAGAVLLLTRSVSDAFLPGIEELPSGGVEDGETLAQALDRELLEEVGFPAGTVDPGFLATFDYLSGSGRPTRQFTVSVPWDDRAVVLSDEHSAYRWVDRSDIDTSSATAETQGVIDAWFDWVRAENQRA
ncbi:NUDIX domain-containing protein [Nocardioides sp. HDW12B]|uniref:NUDIX hydrolase n=1 Tax=Nocardioides sp. HDW12B TaxID=2714939 RepID=UPI00140EC023|nr:NUDIX domain-containing protein [Nocardioides sp. HDW12B]QIK66232.1 NUDIX domain-containing protein [Nocardioides sp. HDW12B]